MKGNIGRSDEKDIESEKEANPYLPSAPMMKIYEVLYPSVRLCSSSLSFNVFPRVIFN
jgi:hypothetical protein